MTTAIIALTVVTTLALVLAAIVWSAVDDHQANERAENRADIDALEPLIKLVLNDLAESRQEMVIERSQHAGHLTALLRQQAEERAQWGVERERLLIAALDPAGPMTLARLEIAAEQNVDLARARERLQTRQEMARQDQARADERFEPITS